MNLTEKTSIKIQRIHQLEVEERLKEIGDKEQIYTIALFDILGFSNFVENNKTSVISEFYKKIVDLIEKQNSSQNNNDNGISGLVPVPVPPGQWKSNVFVADGHGWINVEYFSDTFIIYMNYQVCKQPFWLATPYNEPYPLLLEDIDALQYPVIYNVHHVYLSFLQACMDFFCQATIAGIPLRGCVSTGLAIMNPNKSTYLGSPLVEAARGEAAQNAIGIAFGKSFNNAHPVYNDYFIPYLAHIKEKSKEDGFLSPMMLDWAKYWRRNYKQDDLKTCIGNMNKDPRFSAYYDNAIKFFEFSDNHNDWSHKIDLNGINDIASYYEKVKEWYESAI